MAKSFTAGIIKSAIGNIGPPLLAFASAPVLARSLGPEGRGLVAAATAPLLLASAGMTLGLPEAIAYFTAKPTADAGAILRKALWGIVASGVATSALVLAIAAIFAPKYFGLYCLASAAITPALLIAAVRAQATGLNRWGNIAAERWFSGVVRLLLLVFASVFGFLVPLTATGILALTTFVGLLAYIPSTLAWRPSLPSAQARIYGFAIKMWPGTLAGIMLSRLDQSVMIGLTSTREIGIYAVAVSVSEVVLVFNGAVRDVTLVTQSAEADIRRLAMASRVSTAATVVLSTVAGALCFPLVPILFGEEFDDAASVILVLLIAVVLGNPGSIAGAGLIGSGRPELRSISLGAASVVNIAAVVPLASNMGAMGAAIATLLGNLVAGSANLWWMKRYWKVSALDFVGLRRSDVDWLLRLWSRALARTGLSGSLATQSAHGTSRWTGGQHQSRVKGALLSSTDAPKERQRVLHVVPNMGGGLWVAVTDYMRASESWEHHLLFAANDEFAIKGEALPRSDGRITRLPQKQLLRIMAIRRAIISSQPAVVHAHSSFGGFYTRLAVPWRLRNTVLYTPHCYSFRRQDVWRVTRAAYWLAEALLTMKCPNIAACSPLEFQEAQKLPRSRVAYVPNVARVEILPMASDNRLPKVVAVGRLCIQKDPSVFARAAKEANRRGLRLEWEWIGGGDDRWGDELRAAGVRVTGWLSRSSVIERLAAADWYVHTAKWEGAPITVLEASALNVPVLGRVDPALVAMGVAPLWQSVEELVDLLAAGDGIRRRALECGKELNARHTLAKQADALSRAYRTVRVSRSF